MTYYVWETRRKTEHEPIVDKFDWVNGLGFSFIAGKKIDQHVPELRAPVKNYPVQTPIDDLVMFRARCIAHSYRLASVLAEAGVDNIDYYPLKLIDSASGREFSFLEGQNGQMHERYRMANILDEIYCLDWENSMLEVDEECPGHLWRIHDMHLHEDRLGDVPLFRLGEDKTMVIVHESVKDAVESAGITGPVFLPAEGYRDYPGYGYNNPLNIMGTHDLDPMGPACEKPDQIWSGP